MLTTSTGVLNAIAKGEFAVVVRYLSKNINLSESLAATAVGSAGNPKTNEIKLMYQQRLMRSLACQHRKVVTQKPRGEASHARQQLVVKTAHKNSTPVATQSLVDSTVVLLSASNEGEWAELGCVVTFRSSF